MPATATSKRPMLKLSTSTPAPQSESDDDGPPSAVPQLLKLKPPKPISASTTQGKEPQAPKSKKKRDKENNDGIPPAASSKKRRREADKEDHGPGPSGALPKRLKMGAPATPIIRTKLKGRPPPRPLGIGYDSEASDREEDPAVEEEFILRMLPGEDCDYLRQAIEDKKLGLPKRDGGADVTMKFFNREGRRAVVTIKQRHYAAVMVDLPCIIEGLKSWDRRGWWKTADICQMLLVIGQVEKEEMALTIPLPPVVDPKSYQYPNGLTAPMYNARKRRFRKRISNKTIEAVEDEVERLLAEDAACEPNSSRYEMIDLDRMTRDNSVFQPDGVGFNMLGTAGMHDAAYEEDAEGEVDGNGFFNAEDGEYDDAGLEADLERAMMDDDEDDAATNNVAAPSTAETPVTGAPTPSAAADTADETSDADAEEEAPEEIDEEALERQKELQRQKEEIADLENAIKRETEKMESTPNQLLRNRFVMRIQSLQSDLDLKRAAAGIEDA